MSDLLSFLKMLIKSSYYLCDFYTDSSPLYQKLKYHPQNASIMPLYLAIRHVCENKNKENQNNRKIDLHEKKRLGDITLLESGLNRSIKARDIKYKIKKYLGRPEYANDGMEIGTSSTLYMVNEIEKIEIEAEKKALKLAKRGWDNKQYYLYYQKIIDMREEELIKFAFERWGIPGEENIVVHINSLDAIHDKNNKEGKIYIIKNYSDK